ncbi:MAG: hypothetical protein RIE24_02455 [Silicimonas sp.]
MVKVGQLGYLQNRLAKVFAGDKSSTFVGIPVPEEAGIARCGELPITSVLNKRLTSDQVSHLKTGQKAAEIMTARPPGEPVQSVHDVDSGCSLA